MTGSEELRRRLTAVLDLLAADPASLSSVREREHAWAVHVEDSLSGLDAVGAPDRLADLGAGAGFPGLALAAALPETTVDLIESVRRKAEFIERAIDAAALANAAVVCDRSEHWASEPPPGGGREAYDAVTARAVGSLATVAELASPLLRRGGTLVAWKGRRQPGEEAELERVAGSLALGPAQVVPVSPPNGSKQRHLYLIRKLGPTPADLPRRPGMAAKRPFGRR